jgi:hypothetical protein
MNRSVIQTLDLLEGKKLDKLKKHMKKNWKLYAAGAAIPAAIGGKYYLKAKSLEAIKGGSKKGKLFKGLMDKADEMGKIRNDIKNSIPKSR